MFSFLFVQLSDSTLAKFCDHRKRVGGWPFRKSALNDRINSRDLTRNPNLEYGSNSSGLLDNRIVFQRPRVSDSERRAKE